MSDHSILFRIRRKLRYLFRLIFLSLYRRFRAQAWVMDLLNRKSRTAYTSIRPKLSVLEQRIAQDLIRDGLSISHLDELFPGADSIVSLKRFVETEFSSAQVGRNKTFLEFLWDNAPRFDLNNPVFKFGLEPKLLHIVNAYLGLFARFVFFSVNRTKVITDSTQAQGSQRWHRDPSWGDQRMCKVFIYLSDVDTVGGGPFTYVKGSHKTGKWAGRFPASSAYGFYPQDGAVESSDMASSIFPCTGRAGNVVFCDTTGLHKGGLSISKERVMITYHYVSPASIQEPNWTGEVSSQGVESLPELSRGSLLRS